MWMTMTIMVVVVLKVNRVSRVSDFVLFLQCSRGKAPLIIGIFLVFSPLLSARITSGTGCFRNMAGSWGKAWAKPCRVRTRLFAHPRSMCCWWYWATACSVSFPSYFQVQHIVFFSLCSLSLNCPFISTAEWVAFWFKQAWFQLFLQLLCFLNLKREVCVLQPCKVWGQVRCGFADGSKGFVWLPVMLRVFQMEVSFALQIP